MLNGFLDEQSWLQALAVCDAAAWASQQLDAPVVALHVLDKAEYPAERDLSGNLGLGAREHLLNELSDLDNRRSKIALEQGKLQLTAARERLEAAGITDVETLQRHDSLVNTVESLEDDTRLLIMGRTGEGRENDLETVGSETSERHEQLDRAQKTLKAMGFDVTIKLLEGENVTKPLVEYEKTEGIDLTVMGTHGHSRIRRFFVGSNTSELLRMTHTMTLVLR